MLLSAVLARRPQMSAFDELLGGDDSQRVERALADIVTYLDEVSTVLTSVDYTANDLEWFYEGRVGVVDIHRTLDNIDAVIVQLLNLVDARGDTSAQLLSEFDAVSDLVLEVKRVALYFKKNVDIASAFYDCHNTISGITDEIEEIIKQTIRLRQLILEERGGENNYPESFDDIASRLKITDAPRQPAPPIRSRKLPVTTDRQRSIVDGYAVAEARMSPVSMSLEILPHQIDELNNMCHDRFADLREDVVAAYERLVVRWEYLHGEMRYVDHEFIGRLWRQLYAAFAAATKQEVVQLNWNNSYDGSRFRLVANAMAVVAQGVSDGVVVHDDDLLAEFAKLEASVANVENMDSAPSSSAPSPGSTRRSSGMGTPGGLRLFNTGRFSSSSNDLGIIELKLGKRRSAGDRRSGDKRISSEPAGGIRRLSQEVQRRHSGRESVGSSSSSDRETGADEVTSPLAMEKLRLKGKGSLSGDVTNEDVQRDAEQVFKRSSKTEIGIGGTTHKSSDVPGTKALNSEQNESCNSIVTPMPTLVDAFQATSLDTTPMEAEKKVSRKAENDPTRSIEGTIENVSVEQVASTLDMAHEPSKLTPIEETSFAGVGITPSNPTTHLNSWDASSRDVALEKSFENSSKPDTVLSESNKMHSEKPVASQKTQLSLEELFAKLTVASRQSGLPFIQSDYFDHGYPVIARHPCQSSRLPVYRPRRSVMPSARLCVTPKLVHDNSISFHSTSPERPSSPMGLRQDHLYEALHQWK
ncbi:hypothetical protein DICA1_D00980 [Diutina catenulata]